MLHRILSDQQETLLAAERNCLTDLRVTLTRYNAAPEDLATLEQSIQQLDELFLLVVVGEFNSGKSTFINALLGQPLLAEGVTPTTSKIHLISYGEKEERSLTEADLEMIEAPVDFLREVRIVDTPGTNALERRHEAITEEFVPRSDLVLFVTSADRPFTESERAFMERIREWGKKLVLVINKIDFLRQDSDVDEVVGFIEGNAERLLGFAPENFPISAQKAFQAKLDGDPHGTLWSESRFEPLESYLMETLDEDERVRLKLLNPLGVGDRITAEYLQLTEDRIGLLREDLDALEDIERQLDLYKEDLSREFRFRLTDVDNILHEFEKRGLEFFDETLRLPRAIDLLNKAKIKADFERQVIADAPQMIEVKVNEIIDWMVTSELRQWQAVTDSLEKRRTHHGDRVVGALGNFDYDRNRLLDSVGRAAHRTVESYDHETEATRMAESVQAAVAGTALIEVGALGLGAIVTLLATTQVADVTGILAAGTLAVLGFLVLPARRRQAKKELSDKILDLRRRLMDSLTDQFDREVDRSMHRIEEAIAPYTRFVRAERDRLDEIRSDLEQSRQAIAALESQIEEI
ncbi:MAG: dynamin [Acidobacteria bacterium]|nr:MAG: dynamin [Acidobacteriota bacterium]